MSETLQTKDHSDQPRCEAMHSPLPQVTIGKVDGQLCDQNGFYLTSRNDWPQVAAYIAKACNEHPKLLEIARILAMIVLQSDLYAQSKQEVDYILEIANG